MRKTDALTGLVLGSGAAKQVEYPLVVLGVDAAAVIVDLEDSVAELGPPANSDLTGDAGLEIFDGVVDQIGEDLLQRQTVADEIRQRRDVDLGLRFGSLMRQRRHNRFDQLARVDLFRLEFAPALPGGIEDRREYAATLGDRSV